MSTQTDDSKPASKKRKAGEVSLSDQIPPSGSSSTRSIKQYVFIDKTNMLRRIMAHKEPYIFAPCMRRCGKSTTVTLLKAMAENDRDTLDGMDVCTSDPNSWNLPETAEYYGVVYLDFSQIPQAKVGDPIATIEAAIASFLRERAAEVNITIPNAMKSAKQVLRNWIVQLSRCSKPQRKNSVVVLIDEYDAILNPFLNDPDMLETVSTALKEVFVCLKGADEFIFKAFVTGGLKAGMSGLFSGGNNFHRILDREAQYTSLFGFTKQEIEETYGDHIKEIFQETTLQESLDVMASYYNGYRFHPKQKGTLFNPFSTICYLGGKELDEYWAGTCTSALLKNIMLRHGSDALRGCRISWKALQAPLGKNGMEDSWKSVMFQSGYFSIWDVDEDDLLLGPPNIEVTEYMKAEIARVLQLEASKIGALSLVTQYSNSLRNFDFEKAATNLTSVISKLKYSLVNENEFAGWALHLLRLQDSDDRDFEIVITEISQRIAADAEGDNAKRFDGALVVKDGDEFAVIIVELKFDKTAQEAYEQISDGSYVARCQKYLEDKYQIIVTDENVHSVGFNLMNVPKKIVTCVHAETQL